MDRDLAERCTILLGLVGSTVHGLNVNDGIEDRDEIGVCVESLAAAMSLWDPFGIRRSCCSCSRPRISSFTVRS